MVAQRCLGAVVLICLCAGCNPFAPAFDNSPDASLSILGDPRTIDGIFQNLQYSYTFRDTTIYGQVMNGNYTYVYRDYDLGADISWGRDEDLRITNNLFQNVERLDLIWNNIVTMTVDSTSTQANVSRNFTLTVTFNANDIETADGYVTLSLARPQSTLPWQIVYWRDESNY